MLGLNTIAQQPNASQPETPQAQQSNKPIGTLASIGVSVGGLLMAWGSMTARMDANDERLKTLEAQRSSEVRVVVEQHAKRLDQHDAALTKLTETSTEILVHLSRIEAAVSSKQQAKQ